MEKISDTAEAPKAFQNPPNADSVSESPKEFETFLRVLTPTQAARAMPVILEGAVRSLPAEQHNAAAVNALGNALLTGELQAWFLHRGLELAGVATTYIYTESFVGDKVLCLYTVYSMESVVGAAEWRMAYETLEKYARENGCKRIVAYALNDKVEKLAAALGWTVGPRRLVKEIV